MNTVALRQELHDYINVADKKQLQAMYALMKEEAGEPYEWWNDEFMMAELEQISKDMESGKDKGFTLEESRAQLKLGLNKNG
jgi:hypothetical protein